MATNPGIKGMEKIITGKKTVTVIVVIARITSRNNSNPS